MSTWNIILVIFLSLVVFKGIMKGTRMVSCHIKNRCNEHGCKWNNEERNKTYCNNVHYGCHCHGCGRFPFWRIVINVVLFIFIFKMIFGVFSCENCTEKWHFTKIDGQNQTTYQAGSIKLVIDEKKVEENSKTANSSQSKIANPANN